MACVQVCWKPTSVIICLQILATRYLLLVPSTAAWGRGVTLLTCIDQENNLAFSQKLNIELYYDRQLYSLSCVQENWNRVYSKTCTWIPTSAVFITAKKWKQPKCPSPHEWINKMSICAQRNTIEQGMQPDASYCMNQLWNITLSEKSQMQKIAGLTLFQERNHN
jgi:hypothetical protein